MTRGIRPSREVSFSEHIIEWWRKNRRDFPWRRTEDPYAVLIAEMLLRKTTAQQVERMYAVFVQKYPTPESLANAHENEVRNLLKPLGMEHRRASLLVKFGKTLMGRHNGDIPAKAEELLQLPGIGLYSANAVLSLSHGQDAPMVDTNVIRIVERIFGFKSSKTRPRDDHKIWEFVRSLVPRGRSREFNLSLLDFGAIVCTAGHPACDVCPFTDTCVSYDKEEPRK